MTPRSRAECLRTSPHSRVREHRRDIKRCRRCGAEYVAGRMVVPRPSPPLGRSQSRTTVTQSGRSTCPRPSSRPARWSGRCIWPCRWPALWLLLAQPAIDVVWEHHPSHFWLVLVVAAVNVVLGVRMSTAARRHTDARLFLVSLAFLTSAGFLLLHALATPGILIAPRQRRLRPRPAGRAGPGRRCSRSRRALPLPATRGRVFRALVVVRAAVAAAARRLGRGVAARPAAAQPAAAGPRRGGSVRDRRGRSSVVLYLVAAVRYYLLHRRAPGRRAAQPHHRVRRCSPRRWSR